MKHYVILIIIGLIHCSSFCQTNTFPATGNVGIGTTNPQYQLDIRCNPTWDASTLLGVINSASIYGRSQIIITGRLDSYNDGWNNNPRAALLFNRNNGGAQGAYGTMGYGIQMELNSQSLGFVNAAGTPNMVITQGGYVGLGTTNPNYLLQANGTISSNSLRLFNNYINQNYYGFEIAPVDNGTSGDDLHFRGRTTSTGTFSDLLTIKNSGNVGIGTTSPGSKLQLGNYFQLDGNSTYMGLIGFNKNVNTGSILNSSYGAYQLHNYVGQLQLEVWNSAGSLVTIHNFNNDGSVVLGGSLSGTNASFNGNTTTKKLIVTQTGWADYVFKPSYKLRPLSEVESYIKINKHLPEIPTAKQIEDKGIDVGKTQILLLQKIEEMTIYMIEMKKEMVQTKKVMQKRLTYLNIKMSNCNLLLRQNKAEGQYNTSRKKIYDTKITV